VIAKGHEFPEAERVVEQADGYDVVRKQQSEAAEVAEETDPRS
jgi:predicted RNase H-like HicB family nuclease